MLRPQHLASAKQSRLATILVVALMSTSCSSEQPSTVREPLVPVAPSVASATLPDAAPRAAAPEGTLERAEEFAGQQTDAWDGESELSTRETVPEFSWAPGYLLLFIDETSPPEIPLMAGESVLFTTRFLVIWTFDNGVKCFADPAEFIDLESTNQHVDRLIEELESQPLQRLVALWPVELGSIGDRQYAADRLVFEGDIAQWQRHLLVVEGRTLHSLGCWIDIGPSAELDMGSPPDGPNGGELIAMFDRFVEAYSLQVLAGR